MANVNLVNVSKRYDDGYEAVKAFNLEINAGEFLVLVGPSGCGKSTTLRMIAGLEDISGGEISIQGRVVNDVPPKDRDIAMVFQNYALYPHLSVYDNMAFGLKLRKYPRNEIKARVLAAAKVLGLEELLRRKPKALSGGQRQRVAMGRAIVREPAVFLFDEPLSNLDAKMRVEMRKEILQLHGRVDSTMVYVTHDQVEAMTLGDRICVMNEGRIEQVGPPTTVFDHPASLFVARFIGMPPMNILEGAIRSKNGELVFDGGTFNLPLPAEIATRLSGMENKSVCMGIRPRALKLAHTDDATVIEGVIDVAEMLGEEVLAHVKSGSHRLIASLRPDEAERQNHDHVRLTPDPTQIHVFDAESGVNLTLPHELMDNTLSGTAAK